MVKAVRKKVGLALGGGFARGLAYIGFSDFYRAEECIRRGREAAEKVVPEIQRRLFNA